MRKAVRKTVADPQWFYENILHFRALDWQIEGTNAVFDIRRKAAGEKTIINHDGRPRITIRSCHGPGKTQLLALLMHIWNFTTYGKIACTAPKEAQLTRRLMPRYRRCYRDAEPSYKKGIKVLGKEIVLFGDSDWGAVMETASDPDNLAGFHDNPQLFLIDEASAKRLDAMFPVIEGALTTPGSCSVEIGNPTRVEGEFWAHHNKESMRSLYHRMHIKPEDAPQLVSPVWVEALAQKYGRNSPIFLIRALGEFAAFDEYILIPPECIDAALDMEILPDGSTPTLKISVDVADGGNDSSVITAAWHYQSFVYVVKQKQFYFNPSESPIKCAQAAIDMLEGFGGDKERDIFIVDALGVGAGTAGYLMEKGYNVVRNVGGEGSDDPTKWRNRRVQNYIALYDAFMDERIYIAPEAIDDEEEFRAHLLSIKRAQGGVDKKYDDIETKDKLKQDGQPSPDRADSLAMQYNRIIPNIFTSNIMPTVHGTMETSTNEISLV